MTEFVVEYDKGEPIEDQAAPPAAQSASTDPATQVGRILQAELDEVDKAADRGVIDRETQAHLHQVAEEHLERGIEILQAARDLNNPEGQALHAAADEQTAHWNELGHAPTADDKADALQAIGHREIDLEARQGDAYAGATHEIIDAVRDVADGERDIPGVDHRAIDEVGAWADEAHAGIDEAHDAWNQMIDHAHQQLDANAQDVREGHDPAAPAHDPVDVSPDAHTTADA